MGSVKIDRRGKRYGSEVVAGAMVRLAADHLDDRSEKKVAVSDWPGGESAGLSVPCLRIFPTLRIDEGKFRACVRSSTAFRAKTVAIVARRGA